MAGTRSSARQAGNSSSPASAKSSGGTKRKAEAASPANTKSKRGRPSKAAKEQKTLEETMPEGDNGEEKTEDAEMKDAANGDEAAGAKGAPDTSKDEQMAKELDKDTNGEATNGEGKEAFKRPDGCWFWLDKETYSKSGTNGVAKAGSGDNKAKEHGDSFKGETKEGEDKSDPEKSLKDSRGGAGLNALDQVKADEGDKGKTAPKDELHETEENAPNGTTATDAGSAVETDKEREDAMPSNILEKGLIYFFTRGRVGVEDPESVQDLARSYMVLRPLPKGAKLTDGKIEDAGNNRLCALPKKVWPKSGRDKFMVFIDKAKVSMDVLREEFFQGSDYSTKTTGTRHTPEVTPIGEGVYAITNTSKSANAGESHLAYMLTIPSELSEVQKDMGIKEKGSFVISLKNPESSSPANASLPQGPGYPQDIIDEFRGRGWMAAEPRHIDYPNAQLLLIGEDFENSNNLQPLAKEEKDDAKETPQEELEKLEGEDEIRVEHLKGDDTVFVDLGISSKDYPKVMTTW